jgi:hypothetical protein
MRHNLVCGRSKDRNHDAVIRIGSEAPKRRTHSSNRHESQGTCRESATSNRHRYLITSVRTGPKLPGYPQRPPIIVPDAKRRRPIQRPATRTATERSVACVPRPRSWACEHRERSPCELEHEREETRGREKAAAGHSGKKTWAFTDKQIDLVKQVSVVCPQLTRPPVSPRRAPEQPHRARLRRPLRAPPRSAGR